MANLKSLLACTIALVLGGTSGCGGDYTLYPARNFECDAEVITEYVEVKVPVYVEKEVEVESDPGVIWVDSFVQPKSVDGVDILWVIDTSGSMGTYDPQLLAGIEAMMLALPPTGWRLAMTSNDPDEAAQEDQFPLLPGDDIVDAMDMLSLMREGPREEGFDAARAYIENDYAQSWMRHDAALLVVMVSDEEDQSDDWFADVDDFITWYQTQRGGSVYLSSIINVDPAVSVCDTPPNTIDVGERYMEATTHFNGYIVDICSEDWSPGVTAASTQVEPHEYIELTHVPVEDSIRVFIDQQLNHDWYYEPSENRVYFDVIPSGDSLVEVGYLYHESEDSGDTGIP